MEQKAEKVLERLQSQLSRNKRSGLKQIARARRDFAAIELKTREIAKNTLSAAEFVAETVRAESRHFAHLAVDKVTTKITGSVPEPRKKHHDSSLEPLECVSLKSRR